MRWARKGGRGGCGKLAVSSTTILFIFCVCVRERRVVRVCVCVQLAMSHGGVVVSHLAVVKVANIGVVKYEIFCLPDIVFSRKGWRHSSHLAVAVELREKHRHTHRGRGCGEEEIEGTWFFFLSVDVSAVQLCRTASSNTTTKSFRASSPTTVKISRAFDDAARDRVVKNDEYGSACMHHRKSHCLTHTSPLPTSRKPTDGSAATIKKHKNGLEQTRKRQVDKQRIRATPPSIMRDTRRCRRRHRCGHRASVSETKPEARSLAFATYAHFLFAATPPDLARNWRKNKIDCASSSPRACMYRPFAHLTFSLALALALPLPRRLSPAAFTRRMRVLRSVRACLENNLPVVFEGFIFLFFEQSRSRAERLNIVSSSPSIISRIINLRPTHHHSPSQFTVHHSSQFTVHGSQSLTVHSPSQFTVPHSSQFTDESWSSSVTKSTVWFLARRAPCLGSWQSKLGRRRFARCFSPTCRYSIILTHRLTV